MRIRKGKTWEEFSNGKRKKIGIETRFCKCPDHEPFKCKVTSAKRFISGHNNKGKKRLKKVGEKISKSLKGRSYIDLYGKEGAKEKCRKISKALKKKFIIGELICSWKGKKEPENKKQKRIEALRKKYASGEIIHPMKGMTKETAPENIRKAWDKMKETINTQFANGRLSSNWQGGISFEPYGPEFNKSLKEKIRKRDNYRCQECFRHQDELRTLKTNRKYKLMIHHIDYNKKNNDSLNLLSLCRPCHMQTNYNRNDWTNYFKSRRQVCGSS